MGLAPNATPASKNVPTNATVCALKDENMNVVIKYAIAKAGTGGNPN